MRLERADVAILIAAVSMILAIIGLIISGPPGLQGVSGEPGAPGLLGAQGPQGAQGLEGSHGLRGEVGSGGPRGEKGDRGRDGVDGDDGERGEPGVVVGVPSVLAVMWSPNAIVDAGDEITIIGTAFFHDPEIWLYDSDGEWFRLGQASRDRDNNTFEFEVDIPSSANRGVGEISARAPGGGSTYVTFPILID